MPLRDEHVSSFHPPVRAGCTLWHVLSRHARLPSCINPYRANLCHRRLGPRGPQNIAQAKTVGAAVLSVAAKLNDFHPLTMTNGRERVPALLAKIRQGQRAHILLQSSPPRNAVSVIADNQLNVVRIWFSGGRRDRAHLSRRDCSLESLPIDFGTAFISLLSRASTLSSDRAAISSGTFC